MNIKEMEKKSVDNLEFAREQYVRNKGLVPMIILNAKKEGKNVEIVTILDNEKLIEFRWDIMAYLGIHLGIRTFLKKEIDSVDAIFMVNEAWMSKIDKKESNKDREILRPSEDPKREEIIISTGCSSDGNAVVNMKIIRKKWNKENIEISLEDVEGFTGTNKKDLSMDSALLNNFWEMFKITKNFEKEIDKKDKQMIFGGLNLREYIKTSSTEHLIGLFTDSIFPENKFRSLITSAIIPIKL